MNRYRSGSGSPRRTGGVSTSEAILETARPSPSEANAEARRLRSEILRLRSQLDRHQRLPAFEEASDIYERLDELVVAYLRLQLESEDGYPT